MDKKFMKRYESFKRSLQALREAKERDMSDSFVLSGTSAKYCITFELAWKVMKDILIQYYAITNFVTGSPKEVLRQSFKAQLIENDRWMEMLKIRNDLAHDYDETVIKECCDNIIRDYIDLFDLLESKIDNLVTNFSLN